MGPFNIKNPTKWEHHRSGWRYVLSGLNNLHNPNGILFIDWADSIFRDKKTIKEPWIGIIHNAINYPNEYLHKYKKGIYCLNDLVKLPLWKSNQKTCQGIYTLAKNTKEFLIPHSNIVENLTHPVENVSSNWSPEKFHKNEDKKIFTLGQWLRKYHTLHKIKCPWKKIVVRSGEWWNHDYIAMQQYAAQKTNEVSILNYLNNNEYDEILTSNIVFLDLYDSAACNVILECIIRNTPIIINPLPAVIEYLGDKYPLYYNSIEEANYKSSNIDFLIEANNYLKKIDKTKFQIKEFISSIKKTIIFKQASKIIKMI
jgi:hypothetical protein